MSRPSLLSKAFQADPEKTIAHVSSVYRKHGGSVSAAAAELGVNRNTFAKWAATWPGLQAALDTVALESLAVEPEPVDTGPAGSV